MNNETQDIPNLRFTATREKLDYLGNVIEEKMVSVVPWRNYNPEKILVSNLMNGDLSSVPIPDIGGKASNYQTDFFWTLFPKCNKYEDVVKFRTIESEVVNGIKFVVYARRKHVVMSWKFEGYENEDEGEG